ncbi:MAG: hypothetical protein ACI9XJ_002038 [Marivirga sp.]|jgi:hypothetical protein
MKQLVIFFLTIILSLNCYSQIAFEKGYFITDSNEKIDCLIKNNDWRNNPTEFEYKLTEDSDKIIAAIESVKEFGVYKALKYERHIVKIDKSSNDIGLMSKVKKPIFEEEQLFLKVLVDGAAKLYFFKAANLNRFFYSKDSSEVAQLIFKRYLTPDNKVGENNWYKQQLWSALTCSSFSLKKIESVDYKEAELVDLFMAYNSCDNEIPTNLVEKPKADIFNLSIRPSFRVNAFEVRHPGLAIETAYNYNEPRFNLGIEAEFILPFNKNKWSFLIEPTYHYSMFEGDLGNQNVTIDYKSLELPLGLRYYIFLNELSKVFLNCSFVTDFNFNSTIVIASSTTGARYDLDISSGTNFALGIGFKYNDRYSFELRHQTSRDLLNTYSAWTSSFDSFSIIFAYSFF